MTLHDIEYFITYEPKEIIKNLIEIKTAGYLTMNKHGRFIYNPFY
jgi:serine kinase of HPr protein (carbohydrate metabolism regulator)